MKVGDLIRPINGFRYGGKMEIVQILSITGCSARILVKHHDRSTLNKEPLLSWESADDFVVDMQRTREERLKELGI
jgi:hypothetical protein